MNIKEIVEQVKSRAPAQLGKLPDAKVARILREAFTVILGELANTDHGAIQIGGLGTFRIRLAEVENGSETEVIKRMVFVPVSAQIPNSDEN